MTNRTPTVGAGAASSGACGPPSAWPVLRRLPWPRRFLATTIRGPEPGAHVLEPLPLTRILGSPPDVSLRSLLSFFVFLYLSIFLSVKPRSYGHFPSPTPSMSPRGIFNKTHLLSEGGRLVATSDESETDSVRAGFTRSLITGKASCARVLRDLLRGRSLSSTFYHWASHQLRPCVQSLVLLSLCHFPFPCLSGLLVLLRRYVAWHFI